jgi:hypothetical protein
MKKMTPQEIQNKIYREMPDKKKMEITVQFMRMGRAFERQKNEQISRTRKPKASLPGAR